MEHTAAALSFFAELRNLLSIFWAENGSILEPNGRSSAAGTEPKGDKRLPRCDAVFLLVSCLHEVASALQARRLTLKSAREFHEQAVVSDAANKLREKFEVQIKPLGQELRSMGIYPAEEPLEPGPHNKHNIATVLRRK